ncbi:capsid assembly protein [Pseudomonas weihenstephanensis]|uniref:capsid assembly protein n=1 Tax=Pseudomonas weihenstephanensis TaxID=1608994 RepID=UPI00193B0751|nr:hypothetical protein [Pseudomonas weihenstephanensis]
MRLNMLAAAMGHVLQSADVYASFGVNNAVISSNDISEHEQNMLALDVSARDGDDSLTLNDPEQPESLEEEQEEEQEEEGESEEEGEEEEQEESEEDAFKPLGEPSEELTKASAQIDDYAAGFDQMRAQAVKAGLPDVVADRIESEYEENGQLSEDSYVQLEKAGYSRGFVNSFMQGQEALAETFVGKIMDFAGGKEQFQRICKHLQANSPDAADMLADAISRQDLGAIRTTINLGMASQTKKFGKSPSRTLNRRAAAPAGRSVAGPDGYTSQADMIKDMSSREYREDASFRAKVEARVAVSNW